MFIGTYLPNGVQPRSGTQLLNGLALKYGEDTRISRSGKFSEYLAWSDTRVSNVHLDNWIPISYLLKAVTRLTGIPGMVSTSVSTFFRRMMFSRFFHRSSRFDDIGFYTAVWSTVIDFLSIEGNFLFNSICTWEMTEERSLGAKNDIQVIMVVKWFGWKKH